MNDPVDVGNEAVRMQMEVALMEHASKAKKDEMGRFDVDPDGTCRCVQCGSAVPPARVAAVPRSGLCIQCASS